MLTLQRLVELAEVHEDVSQQLQSLEAAKMQMAEQKLAEQDRLTADLDVRLQAGCAALDCSAGKTNTAQSLPRWAENSQAFASILPSLLQSTKAVGTCEAC